MQSGILWILPGSIHGGVVSVEQSFTLIDISSVVELELTKSLHHGHGVQC